MDKIKECVKRVRNNVSSVRRPIKLKDIKKLQLANKNKEDKLKQFVESFDQPDSD